MPHDDLLETWTADVTAVASAADPVLVRATGAELLGRWAEPHRHYHTRQHLTEMLTALDVVTDSAVRRADRVLTRLAAWLHDAVYDVGAPPGDSERRSASLAKRLLTALDVDPPGVRRIGHLILLTIEHGPQLPGPVADAFIDADLAVLAATEDRFDEYCAQVRAEYAHVPADAYATARSTILTGLVDRPQIYRTAIARSSWTRRARSNVDRELARLRS